MSPRSKRPRAVLDTNVLLSADARLVFTALARQGAFVALWSDITSDELHTNLRDTYVRSDIPLETAHERAHSERNAWNLAHPEAETLTRSASARTHGRAHEKDEHVLAAALLRHADVIVSRDRTAFASPQFPPHLRVENDGRFLQALARLQPRPFARAMLDIDAQFARRGGSRTAADLIAVIDEENRRAGRGCGGPLADRSPSPPDTTRDPHRRGPGTRDARAAYRTGPLR